MELKAKPLVTDSTALHGGKHLVKHIEFNPKECRENPDSRPKEQRIIVGCKTKGDATIALVDTGDVHCIMVGMAGVGKTVYWLYSNLEYGECHS